MLDSLFRREDTSLPRQPLEDVLEPEMAKQYRLRRGEQCRFMPVFSGGRYLCSCGAENSVGESCSGCGLAPEPLTRQVLEELSREAEIRLAQEAEEAARQEAERLAQEARERKAKLKKRIIRMVLLSLSVAAVLALAVGAFWMSTRVWIPAAHYRRGLEALEEGKLPLAHREFTLAQGHEDAEDYLARFYTPVVTIRQSYDDVVVTTENTYDAQGKFLGSVQTDYLLIDGELDQQSIHTSKTLYSDFGLPMYVEDANGKTLYSYNEHMDLVMEEHARADGAMDYTRVFIYEYDEQGRITVCSEICSRHISVNYSYETVTEYTYDVQGRVQTKKVRANFPASVENNYTSQTLFTYDAGGRLIRREETVTGPYDASGDRSVLEEWSFDEAGQQTAYRNRVEFVSNTLSNSVQTKTTVYNSRGDVTEHREENRFPNDPARDYTSVKQCSYNGEGKLTEQRYVISYKDPMRQEISGYTQDDSYSYDLLGRLTKERQVHRVEDPQGSSTATVSYTYAGDGMVETVRTVSSSPEGAGHEEIAEYDEYGLQRELRTVMNDRTVVSEFTYAWFYYPEDAEKPEIIISGVLYG